VASVIGDVVVTALKPAEDGRGATLRLVNPGEEPVMVDLEGAFQAIPVRLDETSPSGAPSDEPPPREAPSSAVRPGDPHLPAPRGVTPRSYPRDEEDVDA
jgi:hypothetical protein